MSQSSVALASHAQDVALHGTAVSLRVARLDRGDATTRHRHAHEGIIYVVGGRGHTIIDGRRRELVAGSMIYIPPGVWHQHHAADDQAMTYLTATNLPLLEAVGLGAAFEEGDTQ